MSKLRHKQEQAKDSLNKRLISPGAGVAPAVVLSDPRYGHNVGAALRACSCFGIKQLWWTGDRVEFTEADGSGSRLPREERMKGYADVELCQGDHYFDAFADSDAVPVAVEVRPNAEPLPEFIHPEKAVYIFGPEDGTLGKKTLHHCHRFVTIPSYHCLNLAGAVYTVLYSRVAQLGLPEVDVQSDLQLPSIAGVEGKLAPIG